MQNISVVIAGDHHVVREALSNLLSMERGINIVGEANDGNEVIMMTKYLCPDVVIMDITMPVLTGPILTGKDVLRIIKRSVPETKVLIFTMHTSEQYVRRALTEGASGYLLKDATSEELIDAIVAVHKGGVALSPSVSRIVVNRLMGQQVNLKEKALRMH